MKRRQTVRRLEVIVILVAVVAVILVIIYLAMSSRSANDAYIGAPVSQKVYSLLDQASKASYGASNSTYLSSVQSIGGQLYSSNGKPILVSATGEHCSPCALQRWPLVMALMRFGNFTNLEYMTSSEAEGDYATFAFADSSYRSSYIVFEPYEVYDRGGDPFQTLPANYSSADQQYGRSSIPFLDFANKYVVSGGLLPDPSLLGTKNWTQIISSIQAGDGLGTQVRQAANVFTAIICKIDGEKPASVCSQSSITGLSISLVSYFPSVAGPGIDLLVPAATLSSDICVSESRWS
jgi:hypothetical protein